MRQSAGCPRRVRVPVGERGGEAGQRREELVVEGAHHSFDDAVLPRARRRQDAQCDAEFEVAVQHRLGEMCPRAVALDETRNTPDERAIGRGPATDGATDERHE